MKIRIRRFLAAAFILTIGLSFALPEATAQDVPTNRNATVKGHMKESGMEVRNAGAGLGTNVRHGRIVAGSKHFGTHMYRAGKHFGKGSGMAAKKTGHVVKNAAKPD